MEKQTNCRIWYDQPAQQWLEALPVGNGKLGAMVYGGTHEETLALNDDTLWAGFPQEDNNTKSRTALPQVRKLIFEGKYVQAQQLTDNDMTGLYTQPYEPLGSLHLHFIGQEHPQQYRRELNLHTGIAAVTYCCGTTRFTREVFSSAPDQCLVMHLATSGDEKLNFEIRLDSPLRYQASAISDAELRMSGKAPSHVRVGDVYTFSRDIEISYEDDPAHGMTFVCGLRVIPEDGSVTADKSGYTLLVTQSSAVTILLSTATSFAFSSPEQAVADVLNRAQQKSYTQLRAAHTADFSSLFDRVSFRLDSCEQDIPTDQLLEQYRRGNHNPALVALLFQYGRYLLLSSSRPGSQPTNLQGIWNEKLVPPWWSNYTNNINLEMFYWPSEVCNLSECHQPLFDFMKRLQKNGRRTAEQYYGCKGWVMHHQTDLWAMTHPVGNEGGIIEGGSCWCMWPMASAWLCCQLWDHYAFTHDETFLRNEAWPLMKEAAEFMLDWLVESPEGFLVTCPSTSPENTFKLPDGTTSAVSYGSTIDMAILRSFFSVCIRTCQTLHTDESFSELLVQTRERLLPYRIGRYDIQEWCQDFDETEPGHRHLSQLFGLFPSAEISPDKTPELAAAARRSLERRLANGGGQTGWSCVWIMALYARLRDRESCAVQIDSFVDQFLYRNLFGICPPDFFQIDCNLGFTAAVAELLLQSQTGELELLPALPREWKTGSVCGLRARGGYTVDLFWQGGQLTAAQILADKPSAFTVRYQGSRLCIHECAQVQLHVNENQELVLS